MTAEGFWKVAEHRKLRNKVIVLQPGFQPQKPLDYYSHVPRFAYYKTFRFEVLKPATASLILNLYYALARVINISINWCINVVKHFEVLF